MTDDDFWQPHYKITVQPTYGQLQPKRYGYMQIVQGIYYWMEIVERNVLVRHVVQSPNGTLIKVVAFTDDLSSGIEGHKTICSMLYELGYSDVAKGSY